MRTTVLILTALLATACSGGSGTPPQSSAPATTSTPVTVAGAGRCQLVAQDGAKVTDALIDTGCSDDNGSLRLGKVTKCKDGRRLWEMGDLIGLSGETMLPRDTKAEGGVTAESLYRIVCAS